MEHCVNHDARVGGGLIWLAALATVMVARAATYYVSPHGNDGNTGALTQPLATVAKGLSRLRPGDTLFLRGGVYYEAGLRIALAGSAAQRTLVASYPGERAEIRGAHPDFVSAPNDLWEIVDASKRIYRTKRTFTQQYAAAWLADENILLPHYNSYESFSAAGCNCGAG